MSGTWFDLIDLNSWIDEKTFFNGASGHINYIYHKFLPLRRKLNLLGVVDIKHDFKMIFFNFILKLNYYIPF